MADRLDRSTREKWLPLAELRRPASVDDGGIQRNKESAKMANKIAREFDPDKFDRPKVNFRDGVYWVVDGWTRCMGAVLAIGADQQVPCAVREGLTDEEAADWCLGLNDYRRWIAFDEFKLELVAGREESCDIDRIVRLHGLCIGRGKEGGISCVQTLKTIYRRGGHKLLARTLKIALGAYGEAGCDHTVLDGLSLLIDRYNGAVDEAGAIDRLGAVRGGVGGLLGKARAMYKQHLGSMSHCIAASAVEVLNAGRGGNKLPTWWKS